jgi:hypothetical protein
MMALVGWSGACLPYCVLLLLLLLKLVLFRFLVLSLLL